jgi:hypothetical protein
MVRTAPKYRSHEEAAADAAQKMKEAFPEQPITLEGGEKAN